MKDRLVAFWIPARRSQFKRFVNELFPWAIYGTYIAFSVNENMDKSFLFVCPLSVAAFFKKSGLSD